jgi:hypothetical protein
MFKNCTALVNIQRELPATTLAEACYYNMYVGCSSLVEAPALPATDLTGAPDCYNSMFKDCTNLKYLEIASETELNPDWYYTDMLSNVKNSGALYAGNTTQPPTPVNWTRFNWGDR